MGRRGIRHISDREGGRPSMGLKLATENYFWSGQTSVSGLLKVKFWVTGFFFLSLF